MLFSEENKKSYNILRNINNPICYQNDNNPKTNNSNNSKVNIQQSYRMNIYKKYKSSDIFSAISDHNTISANNTDKNMNVLSDVKIYTNITTSV